jgi:hypothetical protein
MIQRSIKWMNLLHSFTTSGSPTDLLGLIFVVVSFSVGFEALTTVSMKSTISWDVMPCSQVEVYRHLGGICCPHLQELVSKTRNLQEAGGRHGILCIAVENSDTVLFIHSMSSGAVNFLFESQNPGSF